MGVSVAGDKDPYRKVRVQCETRPARSQVRLFDQRLLAWHNEANQEEGRMDPDKRMELSTKGTVEIIQRDELERLLVDKEKPRAYWGFECSGM